MHMKKKLFSLLVLLLCLVLMVSACQSADPIVQATIDVEGMFCGGCEGRVTAALEDMGVTVLDISAADNFVEVEFNSNDVSLSDMTAILEDAGFEVQ